MLGTDFEPDFSETLRYLGYRGQELSDDMLGRIKAMSELCQRVSHPDYTYGVFELDGAHLIGTDLTLEGESIRRHLDGAEKCVLMAATLGHACDREALRLEAKSLADAVAFNAASVSLIEAVSDRCQREIGTRFKGEGLHINGRFSPGYGDLPLSTQAPLLRLLRAEERLGITLTDGFLMLPRKSVTAVIGLFRTEKTGETRGCSVCGMREFCEYRKGGERCG